MNEINLTIKFIEIYVYSFYKYLWRFYELHNPIYQELIDLKLIDNKNLIKISNKTRDSNVSVFKDSKEDIIFHKIM